MTGFRLRLAEEVDIPEMTALMNRSIGALLGPVLSPAQVQASFAIMGLDPELVADRTYFAAVAEGRILGCGGWSRRRTLFGHHGTPGRDSGLLDPASEPARVRAMYSDPSAARQGVGRAILAASEDAARAAGFARAELVATLAGLPLYRACGWEEVERGEVDAQGVAVPVVRMEKRL